MLAGREGAIMCDEANEIKARRAALKTNLEEEARRAGRQAFWHEGMAQVLFYTSIVLGALAIIFGLARFSFATPEVISGLVAIATLATFISRESKLRAKANWFYAVHDAARELSAKLEFELPIPVTAEHVASISKEWSDRRKELGRKMEAIHEAASSRLNTSKSGSLSSK